jgi:hypothetical protein
MGFTKGCGGHSLKQSVILNPQEMQSLGMHRIIWNEQHDQCQLDKLRNIMPLSCLGNVGPHVLRLCFHLAFKGPRGVLTSANSPSIVLHDITQRNKFLQLLNALS